MNINSLILAIGSEMGVSAYPNHNPRPESEYIEFEYMSETPYSFFDNEAQKDETTIRLHMYTPRNPQPLKKTLRRKLRQKGFDIIETSELNEFDTQLNHIVIEAVIYGKYDDDEEGDE